MIRDYQMMISMMILCEMLLSVVNKKTMIHININDNPDAGYILASGFLLFLLYG